MQHARSAILAILCAIFGMSGLVLATPAQPQAVRVYLPLAIKSQTSAPPTPTPGQKNQGGVFVTRTIQTNSASAAVDAQGGMHTAYAGYNSDNRSAFYAYCADTAAGACANPAQWQTVSLANNVDAVQLALTPQGKPRMLLTINRALEEAQFGALFKYAACDSNCASAASWSIVTVASTDDTDPNRFEQPHRSFALDPQGRPRFVYRSQYVVRDLGTFYVSCDSNCTDPNTIAQHWVQTKISPTDTYGENDILGMPTLAFTKAGAPRLIANVVTGSTNNLSYFACDTNCTERANWDYVPLADRGQGPDATWDLALDSHDQPRIAMYQEALPNDGGNQLVYLWCHANCLDDNNWAGTAIGLGQEDGFTPDLVLNAQDQPRIAYHPSSAAGLSYLWCNSACESDNGRWTTMVVDPNERVDATFPLPVPPACDRASWSTGFRPSLVLDGQGNPRIAADTLREMRCSYTDPSDPSKPPQTRIVTYHYTRFVFLPQP